MRRSLQHSLSCLAYGPSPGTRPRHLLVRQAAAQTLALVLPVIPLGGTLSRRPVPQQRLRQRQCPRLWLQPDQRQRQLLPQQQSCLWW